MDREGASPVIFEATGIELSFGDDAAGRAHRALQADTVVQKVFGEQVALVMVPLTSGLAPPVLEVALKTRVGDGANFSIEKQTLEVVVAASFSVEAGTRLKAGEPGLDSFFRHLRKVLLATHQLTEDGEALADFIDTTRTDVGFHEASGCAVAYMYLSVIGHTPVPFP